MVVASNYYYDPIAYEMNDSSVKIGPFSDDDGWLFW